MKRMILAAAVLAMVPALAWAQAGGESRGHGYFYVAPGTATPGGSGVTMHIGAGGEGFFTRHLGFGADAGYLSPVRSFSDGLGTVSPNFVARFRAKDNENKVEPFVTGGYTLFFRNGTVHGANFGGGVNWWFKQRVGMRFEFRDHVSIPEGDPAVHFIGLRVGLMFR